MTSLAAPRGACRLCGATDGQRRVAREQILGAGQWLMRCAQCGGLWLDPDFTPEALKAFYAGTYRRLFPAEAARHYDQAFIASLRLNEVAETRLDRLAENGFLPATVGGRVLEIGSGYGAWLGRLGKRRSDLRLFASEPDTAHRTVALAGATVQFLDDPAAGAPYDLIAAFHVLEHLPEPAAALTLWRDWLSADGRLVLEVPDCSPWPGLRHVHPAHLSYFRADSLDRLIAGVGCLDVIDRKPPFVDVLWRGLAPGAGAEAQAFSAEDLRALDIELDSCPWTWRDRLRRGLVGLGRRLLGIERLGAMRRRLYRPSLPRPDLKLDCFGFDLAPLDMKAVVARAAAILSGGESLAKQNSEKGVQGPLGPGVEGFGEGAEPSPIRPRNKPAPLQSLEKPEPAPAERLALADLNVAKLVMAGDDPALAAALRGADLLLADGMGIVFALRLLGVRLPERVAGIDLAGALIALCTEHGWRPYLLGGSPRVVAAAAARWQAQHPALRFAGWRDGYFSADAAASVAQAIRATGADLLIVGMGVPLQELFLAEHGAATGAKVTMAVGGAFDVVAGRLHRAPGWMQRAGLEWLFRLVQEPGRLGRRYLITNCRFAAMLVVEMLRRGRSWLVS